jgi:hypothetical protein
MRGGGRGGGGAQTNKLWEQKLIDYFQPLFSNLYWECKSLTLSLTLKEGRNDGHSEGLFKAPSKGCFRPGLMSPHPPAHQLGVCVRVVVRCVLGWGAIYRVVVVGHLGYGVMGGCSSGFKGERGAYCKR